jgi:type II secretory pathway component HofQ
MMPLQSNGTNYTDKDNKMAAMKKAAVKITGTAKSTGGNMKSQPMKKVVKKADPMKASARSHQGDLARMSGNTAAMKKFKADKAAGIRSAENKPSRAFTAGMKAEKRTLKSFK